MSIVEVRCPRCGAHCNIKEAKTDEYICSHCGATFRFVDTSHPLVTTDAKAHICPYCGRHVEAGKGFRCTRCGKDFICSSCVDEIDHKFVCVGCIEQSLLNCKLCRKFGVYRCLSCGKGACKEHAAHVGFVKTCSIGASGFDASCVLFCQHCKGFVCASCARTRLLSSGEKCPKCGNTLTRHSPYQ